VGTIAAVLVAVDVGDPLVATEVVALTLVR
jgi:hypothetical protein